MYLLFLSHLNVMIRTLILFYVGQKQEVIDQPDVSTTAPSSSQVAMNGTSQGSSVQVMGTDTYGGVPSSSSDGDGTHNGQLPMQQQPGFPSGYQQIGPGGTFVPPALVQTASGGNGQLLNGNGMSQMGNIGGGGGGMNLPNGQQMYPTNGGQMIPQMMPNGQQQVGGQINPQQQQQQQQYQQMQQQQMYQQQMMQQQQQQQQQQRGASGASQPMPPSNGGNKQPRTAWHTVEDGPIRNSMIERIVGLLQQRRPNATPDWQEKLPHMAKRLENELYIQAETLAEYSDPYTLKNRLQQLALSMGNKQAAKQPGQGQGQGQPGVPNGQQSVQPGIPGMHPTIP